MADKLTPQQAMAVSNRGGNLLVSAAAGSGKTKVLVDRLLGYLMDPVDPADLNEFLIITYTKAAASELRGKIAAKLTERIAEDPNSRLQQQMQRLFLTKISTVHGFCADLLREYAYRLDIAADFRVADENECREIRETVLADLLDRAYETAAEDLDFRAFVDTQGLGRNDRLVPEIIQQVYDSAKCHLDPEGWLNRCLEAADVSETEDAAKTVWGSYLMNELMEYLDSQIDILGRCVADAESCPGLEKAAINIKATCNGLRSLRSSNTWDEVVQRCNVPFDRYPTIRKCDDPDLKDRIKAARDACKDGLPKKLRPFADPSSQVLADLSQSAAGTRGLVALVRQFDREFTQAKRSRRCVDFSDLEHRTLDLLLGKQRSGPTAAAAEIAARFREVMVDEYQDSNEVQDEIFKTLTRQRKNCFMVGDVKQSIYQFRLADPTIFLAKYGAYAPAETAAPGEGRKILLSHNFRSGGEVIEAVNDVFATCMSPKVGGLYYGAEEALREGIPHEALPDPAVELYAIQAKEDSYAEEAAFVAERISQMLRQGTLIRKGGEWKPVTPDDIVILLRSPGSAGGYFQRALEARGIRYTSGGGNDLLQTAEIATVRSLLQTVYNPRQDIPLISTLMSPIFGFGADDMAAFRGKRKYGSVYDALLQDDSQKARDFRQVLDTLRREARMNSLTELIEQCYALTRLDSIYAAMEGGAAKAANLRTFFQLAVDFEMGTHRDLGQFLDHLQALEEKGLRTAGTASGGCVTIMSIHKSKGLEFPVVFLCGLSRKFNRDSLQAQILCDKTLGLGLSVADRTHRIRYPTIAKRAIASKMAAESLSEELRVLYVAMTRARDRLIMTYTAQNLQKDLQNIALRMDLDGGAALCREVNCPGKWVLITAMHRLEAGELFVLGGRPAQTRVSDIPWRICACEVEASDAEGGVQEQSVFRMPEATEEILGRALAFRYPYQSATVSASKQTATGRKGRNKDEEAAENAGLPNPEHRSWRRPSFLQDRKQGKDYGNAFHNALQYVRYAACCDEQGVRSEVDRLVREGFLTEEQGSMVECGKIAAFFQSELGQKLRSGVDYLREFKISILDDASRYGDDLEGEKVLLQGVVDCAILEEDGITIVDFKTDRVSDDTIADAADRYTLQVRTYAEALSRVYELPIKHCFLYFFYLDRFYEI